MTTIGVDAFVLSNLVNLVITEKVTELEVGWCRGLKKVKNIEISNKNKYLKSIDNKYIVKKRQK